MAKKQNAEVSTEVTEGAVAAPAARGKKIMITNISTGETIARADFIKARFIELGPQSRSTIVKELAEQFGHVVPYQIVFAATKTPKEVPAAVEAVAEAPAEDVAAE